MDRLDMPGSMPADLAELLGDAGDIGPEEQQRIDERAEEIIDERLEDPTWRNDLLSEQDTADELGRAIANLDDAINGNEISRTAVFTALSHIQRAMKNAARDAWLDDCRELAEREMSE